MNQNLKAIETTDEFFTIFRDVIKNNTNSSFDIKQFRNYTASNANKTRLTQFLNKNIKTSLDDLVVETKLRDWLKDKEYRDTFIFNKNIVKYNYMPKLQNEKDLVQLIEKSPQGVLLNEDMMKYTYPEIRSNVRDLIKRRECLVIRSKNAEKNKLKDQNYEGCYLFALPPEIKAIPNLCDYFKISQQMMQSADCDKKLQAKYETKTSQYRQMYEQICSENINKQSLKNPGQISAEGKKIVELADEINRKAIPQLQQILQKRAKQKK